MHKGARNNTNKRVPVSCGLELFRVISWTAVTFPAFFEDQPCGGELEGNEERAIVKIQLIKPGCKISPMNTESMGARKQNPMAQLRMFLSCAILHRSVESCYCPHSPLLCVTIELKRRWYSLEVINEQTMPR